MQTVLDAIRKACLPGVWSQGVKLAREGAVSAGTATPEELTFRVRAPGHAIALTVTLYAEGPEWTCDCEGKIDPCAHVAAAAIAAAQAAERGESLAPGPHREGRAPRLSTGHEGPAAHRRPRPRARGRPRGAARRVDRLQRGAGPRARGLDAGARGPARRAHPRDARARGRPAGARPRSVRGVRERRGGDARRRRRPRVGRARAAARSRRGRARGELRPAPRSRSRPSPTVVAKGVVRCGDVLHPIGEASTTGELLERLPLERTFTAAEAVELVTTRPARARAQDRRRRRHDAASRAPRPMRVRASRWTSRTRDTRCRCCRRSCTAIPPWPASTGTRSSRSATPFRRAVRPRSARLCGGCATS